MIRSTRTLLAVIALLGVLAVPATALAEVRTDVFGGGAVYLTDLEPGKEPTLNLRLIMRSGLKPPFDYEVGVPLPEGSQPLAVVETDPTDPENKLAKKLEDVRFEERDGQKLIVFKVEFSPYITIEAVPPKDMVTGSAPNQSVDLYWTALSDFENLRMWVSAPPGYMGVPRSEITTIVANEGNTLYALEKQDVKSGTEFRVQVDLKPGTDPAVAPPSPAGSTATTGAAEASAVIAPAPVEQPRQPMDPMRLTMLVLGIIVVVIFAVIVFLYGKQRPAAEDEAEE